MAKVFFLIGFMAELVLLTWKNIDHFTDIIIQ